MAMDFDFCYNVVRNFEGGFSNHTLDPGGATKWGITQSTYNRYLSKKGLPQKPVSTMSPEECQEIYHDEYWVASRAKYLKEPLNLVVFDTAVNFGVGRSNQFLAEAFGLPKTVTWNPKVSKLIHIADPHEIAANVLFYRAEYRGRRVLEKADQVVFLKGWLNRDRKLRDLSSKYIHG